MCVSLWWGGPCVWMCVCAHAQVQRAEVDVGNHFGWLLYLIREGSVNQIQTLNETQSLRICRLLVVSLLWGSLVSLEAEIAGRPPHPKDMHMGFWGPELPTSHTELADKCLTPETFLQSLK